MVIQYLYLTELICNTNSTRSKTPSNYIPIDYNSKEAEEYNQRYNSVGGDNWPRLYNDWKQSNPTSNYYTFEQFKTLAHDGKYGPVHAFIKGYPLNNQASANTDINLVKIDVPDNIMANDFNEEPSPIPTLDKPQSTTDPSTKNNFDSWKEAAMFFNPARLAPLFNDIYNVANQQGADPTFAQSVRGAYTPVQAEQFGTQMNFTPFDWRSNEIAQRAKARSSQQAMMNIAGGNNAAATANLALQNTN